MMKEASTNTKIAINDKITFLWSVYAGDLRRWYFNQTVSYEEAEDLVQETFLRFYMKLIRDQQEPEKQAVISNDQAYLFAIARNIYRSHLSKQKGVRWEISADRLSEELPLSDLLIDPNATPEEALVQQEQLADLDTALMTLPENEYLVLHHALYNELTMSQIAKRFQIPRSKVNTYLLHARRSLQRQLLREQIVDNHRETSPLSKRDDASPAALELANAIASLPDPYRTFLTLAKIEGRKYTQIAAQMHCPLGTVKGRIARGMALLKVRQQTATSLVVAQQSSSAIRDLPHLDALPEHHRQLLILREVHSYSYAAIAERLQITPLQVKKQLHTARVAYHAIQTPQPRASRKTPRRRSIPSEHLHSLYRLNRPAYRHFYDVLSLAYIEGLSDQEIAARLHRPVGTIKAHLVRGAKLLAPVSVC